MGSTLGAEEGCEAGVEMELGCGFCSFVNGSRPAPVDCCGDDAEAITSTGRIVSQFWLWVGRDSFYLRICA